MSATEIVILIFWLFPLLTACSMTYGYVRAKKCFQITEATEKIIIQITTVENFRLVNKTIATIRSYKLAVPYEIWIVTEAIDIKKYINADKIIVVHTKFPSIAKYKARALDYSAEIRKKMGIVSENVKILFIDDDALPSKPYIEKCYFGNYDIMEGIIQPRLNYGTRYSYVENMRTLACMSVCSVYQGHGHPVWVHGEGICVRASVEQKITWKFDVIASEDLVFGHTCATRKMRWGFIWEPMYITSPWTLKDYFRQRHRWLWGNVHAIHNILTWKSKIRMVLFYSIGTVSLLISVTGIILDLLGYLDYPLPVRVIIIFALGTWLGIYGYIGYVVGNKKIRHILLSVVLVWYTSLMNTFPIWIGLLFKRPVKFAVIAKERGSISEEQE
jgi:cellulose synthase/poly-beta-1,6-N-acetylglucosamine synthase-like glycosyltransferase